MNVMFFDDSGKEPIKAVEMLRDKYPKVKRGNQAFIKYSPGYRGK